MKITISTQITFINILSNKHELQLNEISNAIQSAMDIYVANLKKTDSLYFTKCKVHDELTEEIN